MTTTGERTAQTNIWIPTALVRLLDEEAKREGRTRQKQLEWILRERFARERTRT